MGLERKVNLELFNERVESKADKQMVLNAVINKVSKIELDQVLSTKVDRLDFDSSLNLLKATVEEDMQSLLDCLGTKASLDDLSYF